MFKKIYNWYMKTFLPFEDPSHPLYSNGSTPKDEFCQEISDFIDSELEGMEDLIGPNYSRKMGDKPTQYEKWGNKWYKKEG